MPPGGSQVASDTRGNAVSTARYHGLQTSVYNNYEELERNSSNVSPWGFRLPGCFFFQTIKQYFPKNVGVFIPRLGYQLPTLLIEIKWSCYVISFHNDHGMNYHRSIELYTWLSGPRFTRSCKSHVYLTSVYQLHPSHYGTSRHLIRHKTCWSLINYWFHQPNFLSSMLLSSPIQYISDIIVIHGTPELISLS